MTDRPTMKPGRSPAGPPPAAPTPTVSIIAVAEALIAEVRRIADALEPTTFELVGDERTPPTPSDDDALRSARRDSLLVLLSRAGRGVLTPDEATLLRHHVEAEISEADTARAERDQLAATVDRARTFHGEMEARALPHSELDMCARRLGDALGEPAATARAD